LSLGSLVRGVASYHNVLQSAMDSKYRVLINSYPVTALGVLDAGQQFNLIELALSNKEYENMYSAMMQGVESVLQSVGVQVEPECTMSDNSDAIQKSFIRLSRQ
jgi:MULE transposase domain